MSFCTLAVTGSTRSRPGDASVHHCRARPKVTNALALIHGQSLSGGDPERVTFVARPGTLTQSSARDTCSHRAPTRSKRLRSWLSRGARVCVSSMQRQLQCRRYRFVAHQRPSGTRRLDRSTALRTGRSFRRRPHARLRSHSDLRSALPHVAQHDNPLCQRDTPRCHNALGLSRRIAIRDEDARVIRACASANVTGGVVISSWLRSMWFCAPWGHRRAQGSPVCRYGTRDCRRDKPPCSSNCGMRIDQFRVIVVECARTR